MRHQRRAIVSEQVCLFISIRRTLNLAFSFPSSSPRLLPGIHLLPVGQHVLDVAVVLRVQVLRELLLGQPLEVLEALGVDGQIGLTGHHTRLQEEDLATGSLDLGCVVRLRAARVERVPSDRVEADKPGVHVDTSGLGEGTFSSLRGK
jgi:hypothetical protein